MSDCLDRLRAAREVSIRCARSGEAAAVNTLSLWTARQSELVTADDAASQLNGQCQLMRRLSDEWREAVSESLIESALISSDEPAIFAAGAFHGTGFQAAGYMAEFFAWRRVPPISADDVDDWLRVVRIWPTVASSEVIARVDIEFRCLARMIQVDLQDDAPMSSVNNDVAATVGANRERLFPEGTEGWNRDVIDLAGELDTHGRKRANGKSDRQIALEFTGESKFDGSKAKSLLAQIQRYERFGKLNLPKHGE